MAKDNDPQYFSSGYERNRLDRYWTHPWMTNELVDTLHSTISGPVWECAAGRGDMSKALKDKGFSVYSTDIDMSEFNKVIGPGHERNFLDERVIPIIGVRYCRSIITNPPYNTPRGVADEFVKKGLYFMGIPDGIHFMAMLLRSEFRSGKSRRSMFGACLHYMGELVLTTRPRWDYDDPDAPENAAPRHNFSWYLWRKDWRSHHDPIQLFSYMPKGFKP